MKFEEKRKNKMFKFLFSLINIISLTGSPVGSGAGSGCGDGCGDGCGVGGVGD